MKMSKLFQAAALPFILSGCAGGLMPYESEFSCPLSDQYGKCVDVEGAYEEAVTGESRGELMVPASKRKKTNSTTAEGSAESVWKDKESITHTPSKEASITALKPQPTEPLDSYSDSRYRELQGLLEQPRTPMLRPPKTVRTLVLAYSDDGKKKRLFMPRYVYTIVEESNFVLGNYLNDSQQSTEIFESGIAE